MAIPDSVSRVLEGRPSRLAKIEVINHMAEHHTSPDRAETDHQRHDTAEEIGRRDALPNDPPYDSFLLVSFGGPEHPDHVMPFLENVLRGKNVPRQRMLEVADHYQHFGGISPINEQNRRLLAAIEAEFRASGVDLPVYWGNRNWHPLLADTLRTMHAAGHRRTLAFFTSMFSSYSGCRQYRENIVDAQHEIGLATPRVDRLRLAFNHPGFIGAMADQVTIAVQKLGGDRQIPLLFTAHSIPLSMAEHCAYERQLQEACRLVAERCGMPHWQLVYQSRSGPPQQPWLEPDICDWIAATDDQQKLHQLVIVPIGFISDHIEVLYDLDEEAAGLCRQRSIRMERASTVGTDRQFVTMIRQLVQERLQPGTARAVIGDMGPVHDFCPDHCCLYPAAQQRRQASQVGSL